jgi:hypothetical protein
MSSPCRLCSGSALAIAWRDAQQFSCRRRPCGIALISSLCTAWLTGSPRGAGQPTRSGGSRRPVARSPLSLHSCFRRELDRGFRFIADITSPAHAA